MRENPSLLSALAVDYGILFPWWSHANVPFQSDSPLCPPGFSFTPFCSSGSWEWSRHSLKNRLMVKLDYPKTPKAIRFPPPRARKHIGGDSPHGVFDPWARWDLGLVRIRSFSVVVVTGHVQFVYTLILKNSSQGGVPDGADRSKITWYVDMF